MKPKLLYILCAVLAVCWLTASVPAQAWQWGQANETVSQTTAPQPGDAQASAPRQPSREPRGVGLQFIPIILIIPLAWLFFRGLQRRRDDQDSDFPSSGSGKGDSRFSQEDDPEHLREAYRRARAQWEWMEGGESRKPGEAAASSRSASASADGGFDESEFLRGAKLAYARLTEAFDALDADAAAPFAAEAVVEGLRARARSGAVPTSTELVLVEAELLEHSESGESEEAVVLFDALVRRGNESPEPEEVRQVWRFGRDPRDPSSMWRLERMESYSEPAS